MHFNRVYVEITNICGLACSFCPPKVSPPKTMSLEFFQKIAFELQPYTKTLALHVMGDPLRVSNLSDYLDIALTCGFEIELTTSGYYIGKTKIQTLFHPAVRQLNISLNSYNKNSSTMKFDDYINPILELCLKKTQNYPKPFVNLRLWNLDDMQSEERYNNLIFEKLNSFFGVNIQNQEHHKTDSIRLASKVLLNFDNYFEWPSLLSSHNSNSTCHGLKSHIAILANGTVVPCCLDGEGVIALGDLNKEKLKNILNSSRAKNITEGFKKREAIEELCKKCSYKDRF